ncbi:MAG: AAA family ATPase [Chloroflexota bacterium]
MSARHSSPRFVGRERELARIATALERAAGGRTTSLLLTGSAGLGSSRLLDEVERRLALLDAPFQVVRCSLEASLPGEPYGPIVAGFQPALGALDDAALTRVIGPVAEPIARLLPDLEPRLASAGILTDRPWIVDPERRQARLLEALLGCLERLGERAPVLLIIEDLHAADFGTRALATFLARITRPGRLAMIATYQPDELTRDHPLRADLEAMAEANEPPATIALDPLGRDALAALIEGIEERRPSASELLLVTERSRGNPLVAEEIVAARRELTGVSLAGPFEQIVMARLAGRTSNCQRVLRLLALAGGTITRDELAAAVSHDGADPATTQRSRSITFDLAASIEEAADHGYLLGVPGGSGVATGSDRAPVQLRHQLIASAIAADMLPGQFRRDHTALGRALDGRPAASLRHWIAIHRTAETRSTALRAAEEAERVDAPGDALAALEIALRIGEPAGSVVDVSAQVVLLRRAAEAAFSIGRTRRAVAFIESALGQLGPSHRLEAGRLHERLGLYRRVDGDHAGGLEAQREAVRLIPPAPSVDRATALASLAQALMLDGSFSEAKARANEAVAMADDLGEVGLPAKSHATCTLGICEAYGGDLSQAVQLLEESRALSEQLRRLDQVFRSLANITTTYELQWRQGDAIRTATEGIDRANREGLETVYGNQLRGNVASSLILVGRWDDAREMSQRGLEWSPAGPAFVDPAISLAAVEVESKADEHSANLLGRLLLELEILPDPQYVVPASRVVASFALWRGDVGDARGAAERGWSLLDASEDWIAISRMAGTLLEVLAAQVADAKERRDLATVAEARTRAAVVLDVAERAVQSADVSKEMGSRRDADSWLNNARAHRKRLNGDVEPDDWNEAAEAWAAIGDPYQEARARWRQAEALLTYGDGRAGRSKAIGPLREAYRAATKLGAGPLIRELEALAGRALIKLPLAASNAPRREKIYVQGATTAAAITSAFAPPPSGPRSDAFGLSPREREVLRLIAQGRTNRDVGDRLFISQKTVGVHVGNILAKLGVSGRVEAATVALRLGLADSRRDA